jgi:hypothetical protein
MLQRIISIEWLWEGLWLGIKGNIHVGPVRNMREGRR